MVLNADQHVGEVSLGIDVVELAGGDQGTEDRQVLSGLLVSDEEIVLSPQRDDAQQALGEVVVRRELDDEFPGMNTKLISDA